MNGLTNFGKTGIRKTIRAGMTGIRKKFAYLGSALALTMIILMMTAGTCMADDSYLADVTQWLSNRVEAIGNVYQGALEDASDQQQQEKLAQQIQYVCHLMTKIQDDTPWEIHVNLSTCTVTIFRVIQIEPGDLTEWLAVSADSSSGLVLDSETESRETRTQSALIPVYACPCSVGTNGGTPIGNFTIQDHLRWHELIGPSWGQWCCHFAPSYLFHSLPYSNPNDPYSMLPSDYNAIGTAASHGCVRLTAIDAKYIYDHAPTGTNILIFTGVAEDDPLGTPERPFVGEWEHSYDPTDPELPENQEREGLG